MDPAITLDPAICHGQAVIAGTRVSVAIVVGSLAGGMSFDEVATEYDLTPQQIRDALRYAGRLVEHEQHHPLPAA